MRKATPSAAGRKCRRPDRRPGRRSGAPHTTIKLALFHSSVSCISYICSRAAQRPIGPTDAPRPKSGAKIDARYGSWRNICYGPARQSTDQNLMECEFYDMPLFRGCDRTLVDPILEKSPSRIANYRKGEFIAMQNSVCRSLLLLCEGSVRVQMTNEEGREFTLDTLAAPRRAGFGIPLRHGEHLPGIGHRQHGMPAADRQPGEPARPDRKRYGRSAQLPLHPLGPQPFPDQPRAAVCPADPLVAADRLSGEKPGHTEPSGDGLHPRRHTPLPVADDRPAGPPGSPAQKAKRGMSSRKAAGQRLLPFSRESLAKSVESPIFAAIEPNRGKWNRSASSRRYTKRSTNSKRHSPRHTTSPSTRPCCSAA